MIVKNLTREKKVSSQNIKFANTKIIIYDEIDRFIFFECVKSFGYKYKNWSTGIIFFDSKCIKISRKNEKLY